MTPGRGYLSFELGTDLGSELGTELGTGLGTGLGTNISIRDICTDWNPSVESIHNLTV